VFHARFSPKAEFNARAHRRFALLVVLLSALVAAASLTEVMVPRPVGADQITGLRAQATALSQRLVQEQLQVDAYQQQVSVASAKVTADDQAMAQIDQQISQDQSLISQRTGDVRQQAIRSYIDYGTGSTGSDATLFTGNEQSAQAASEYSGIAVGNITTAVDQLRTAQHSLQANEAALQQQHAQDLAEQALESSALSQANSTQGQLEASQAQVTGQLAVAVQQQAAAQDAAAAAAVAAAQRSARAATSSSASGSGSSSGSSGSSAPTTSSGGSPPTTSVPPAAAGPPGALNIPDPALNPFLQCVVQAESGGNYGAVSPNGVYMGAFQFSQPTWNVAAQAAGLPSLVGVPPNLCTKAEQDTVAVALYALDGERPWLGDRCS
jgi:peptidoglycan hydrolase CwlO-like protein